MWKLDKIAGKTIFGEMTYSKDAGFDKIRLRSFDQELGKPA